MATATNACMRSRRRRVRCNGSTRAAARPPLDSKFGDNPSRSFRIAFQRGDREYPGEERGPYLRGARRIHWGPARAMDGCLLSTPKRERRSGNRVRSRSSAVQHFRRLMNSMSRSAIRHRSSSGNRVYVGIANHADNPIQNGRVAAVNLFSGNIVHNFRFKATGTRGGGVWGFRRRWPRQRVGGIYVTTSNARCWNGGCQAEPYPNHGLSLLRLDADTGAVIWKLQPVPFDLDGDPDWSSGAALNMDSAVGR